MVRAVVCPNSGFETVLAQWAYDHAPASQVSGEDDGRDEQQKGPEVLYIVEAEVNEQVQAEPGENEQGGL